MRALPVAAAWFVATTAAGCAFTAGAANLQSGDCLRLGGTADRPEAVKAACGSAESNFRVAAKVADSDQCPADADSSYTAHSTFADAPSTLCLDIDWVIGTCMNVDPEGAADPYRVDCHDADAPHRERALEILDGVADVSRCATGQGHAYDRRRFTVCVEAVS
ncbi:hypothetical protein LV457_16200 [Mycobacterium sp. MYCO198283]|uniref:LppU family putative lipoprotein n=1 Tax=Mycobacterium sp. MYCO198283 TaxID=2883505 RepID=UPI001E56A53F|nr:hypothetical protein [Mycobacterium sp. MYCO198283]MCG5433818.1 hypothetical protein [Mycobacterium sp. MYCO198283]